MALMQFDVLILGTGIAGLASAIKLAETSPSLKIALLTREKDPLVSNTFWAQGGIIYNKVQMSTDSNDSKLLIEDIMKASQHTSSLQAAQVLVDRSPAILEEILLGKVHTDFTRNSEGELSLTKEAAHSSARIIYKDDSTGKAIQISLLNYLKDPSRFPNITFLTDMTAIDLITPGHHGVSLLERYEDHQVVGVYAYDQDKECVHQIHAKNTILATGGIGALYLHHSNAEGARGDGHAMAKRAGAAIINMEFIQFHPTTFYDQSSHRRFLISEAVRGEGGILINAHGERFMERYHPDLELAPRDVVTRAILDEMILTKHDCVYLDISFMGEEWIQQRFPTIYNHCLLKNIDMTKQPIPVVPAAHYTCGGVKTNLQGATNIKNLYAVGEVACTGLHGANRLASTSLLEGLTWGYLAAEDILSKLPQQKIYPSDKIRSWEMGEGDDCDLALVHQDWLSLKQTMWNYVGPIRSKTRLQRAQAMFSQMYDGVGKFYKHAKLHDELIGLRNGIEVAEMVVKASQRNKKSIGCFYLRS